MAENLLTKNGVSLARRRADETGQPLGRTLVACLLLLALYPLVVVLSIGPLARLAPHPVAAQLPGKALAGLGPWLADWLVTSLEAVLPFLTAADLDFHVLILGLFLLYGLLALLLWRCTPHLSRRVRTVLWYAILAVTLVSGGILVMAPAMLSHDIFVYVGYGRVIAVHQANPYFVPLAAFPQDPFYPLDDWREAVAAYGPLWLGICSLFSVLLGTQAVASILAFRLLALAAHLGNTLLVRGILRAASRSERVIALGTLLVALNPLILLESALGAHNDTVMMTFVLLGLWWSLRADRAGRYGLRAHLPALLALTLAMLIKFTALVILGLLIVMLVFRVLRDSGHVNLADAVRAAWRPALRRLLASLACCGLLGLLAYLPFWLGHAPLEIIVSLVAPPSTSRGLGQFSILRAIQEWAYYHPHPVESWSNLLLLLLQQRSVWNAIDVCVLSMTLLVALWRLWQRPVLVRLISGGLLVLGGILIVTPWFFPWYLVWLLPLAALSLPQRPGGLEYALLGSTLIFSLSAFAIYLSRGYPPVGGGWIGWMGVSAVMPPLLAFALLCWFSRGIGDAPHVEGEAKSA